MRDSHARRLLWCYPRAYRRTHGDELVATVLAAAPSRPSLRLRVNLIRHGLRCRLGRPASRTVVVWSLVFAVMCGLFVAAGATRVAWRAARMPPDEAEAAALLHEALPDHDLSDVFVGRGRFVFYSEPVSREAWQGVLSGDGGEYQQGTTGGAVNGPAVDLGAVQQRLRANGWRVYDPVYSNAYDCAGPPCDPARIPTNATLIASRGDVVATLTVNAPVVTPAVSFGLVRSTPPAVYPAGFAGLLVGGVLAWLAFGWVSRRTDHRGSTRVLATMSLTFALLLWWPPAILATIDLTIHQLSQPHPSWHPLWEWLGQPTFSLPFLAGTAWVLAAATMAAVVPPRQPSPQWRDATR